MLDNQPWKPADHPTISWETNDIRKKEIFDPGLGNPKPTIKLLAFFVPMALLFFLAVFSSEASELIYDLFASVFVAFKFFIWGLSDIFFGYTRFTIYRI